MREREKHMAQIINFNNRVNSGLHPTSPFFDQERVILQELREKEQLLDTLFQGAYEIMNNVGLNPERFRIHRGDSRTFLEKSLEIGPVLPLYFDHVEEDGLTITRVVVFVQVVEEGLSVPSAGIYRLRNFRKNRTWDALDPADGRWKNAGKDCFSVERILAEWRDSSF